jgi:hypothetical protein
VLLPPGVAASSEPLALVSALARPGPTDSRYLGVPLDWLRLEPLGGLPLLDLALLCGAVAYALWAMGQGLSAIGYRLSAIGYRLSATGYRLLPLAWVLAHLLLLPLPPEWRNLGALVLLLLPGALLALLLFRHEADALLLAFLGLCGGLALWALLLLALHALPGPLPGWLVLLACNGLIVALGYRLWVIGERAEGRGQRTHPLTPHPSPLTPHPLSCAFCCWCCCSARRCACRCSAIPNFRATNRAPS